MDSLNMPQNYANSNSMKYSSHRIKLLSGIVSFDSPKGKFSLPFISTNTDSSSVVQTKSPKSSGKVINKDSLGGAKVTTNNYIELEVPKYLFYVEGVVVTGGPGAHTARVKRKEYYQGQEFIIINTDGNYDKPLIVGVFGEQELST